MKKQLLITSIAICGIVQTVPFLANAQSIAAGQGHSIFLCNNTSPRTCGYNYNGQLGDGSTADKHIPVQVSSVSGIIAVAGGWNHSLFLKNDGTVWACGANTNGQLGDGTNMQKTTPVQVSTLSGIILIVGGTSHSLFLKNDGTVYACGKNSKGELGDGTTTDKNVPVQISSLSGITAIAAGDGSSLFLKNDGTVWACGYNYYGQLGNGTGNDVSAHSTPTQVSTLNGITAIACGGYHSLVLKNDGTVWAWGDNASGELGDGTTTDKYTPVQTITLSGITAIAGGISYAASSHSLFLKNNGSVYTCGNNMYGQLGDGTVINKSTPVQIASLNGIIAIAGGTFHSLFLKNDGTAWACGGNSQGALGDSTTVSKLSPVKVKSLCYVAGIEENFIENNIFIYPNPFSAQTVLQTDNFFHNATLTVYNSFGQTVKQIKNISGQTTIFHRDNLPSGLYFIRLTQDNKTFSADKLVIADN